MPTPRPTPYAPSLPALPRCSEGFRPYLRVAANFTSMARERTAEIVAEMVANVMTVTVAEGDAVEAGDTVVVLESMKMEIPVIAEAAGTVRSVKVAEADVVLVDIVVMSLILRHVRRKRRREDPSQEGWS